MPGRSNAQPPQLFLVTTGNANVNRPVISLLSTQARYTPPPVPSGKQKLVPAAFSLLTFHLQVLHTSVAMSYHKSGVDVSLTDQAVMAVRKQCIFQGRYLTFPTSLSLLYTTVYYIPVSPNIPIAYHNKK